MRKPLTIQREKRAFELACDGMTYQAIADQMDAEGLGRVSKVAVHKMLKRVNQAVLADLKERGEEQIALQHARLMKQYREAMAAWEASKKPQKTLTTKQADGTGEAERKQPRPSAATVVVKDSQGDPRYLEVATRVLCEINKLWGLHAPQKTELSGTVGVFQAVEQSAWAGATVEQLEAIRAIQQQIAMRNADEPGTDG